MKIKSRAILVIVLEIVLFSACSRKISNNYLSPYDIDDGGFLSQKFCGPPCFWGIVPDQSSDSQAINEFQEHFNTTYCTQWEDSIKLSKINCGPIIIFFDSSIVDSIQFIPSRQFSLNDVIDKYGQPNAVRVIGWSQENQGETTSVSALIYYDNIHCILGFSRQDGKIYSLENNSVIQEINYLGKIPWEKARNEASDWKGYGEYNGPYYAGP